jgi:HEAT repeat protein
MQGQQVWMVRVSRLVEQKPRAAGLRASLRDAYPQVRAAAINTLPETAPEELANVLVHALADSSASCGTPPRPGSGSWRAT